MNKDPETSEIVAIVDKNDNELYGLNRKEMREKVLIHRATYIFVFNPKEKKFFIQKRSLNKKYCPGYWDFVFGGCVQYQEPYDLNAERELEEELGIKGTVREPSFYMEEKVIEPLFKFYFEDKTARIWGKAFLCFYSGEVKPQEEEIEIVKLMSMEEMIELEKNGEKIAEDGLKAFHQLRTLDKFK